MIYSHHCYNPHWRQQMGAAYMEAANDIGVADHNLVGLNTINTAEDLLAANLEGEALDEAFASLSLEEQARYLDLLELNCPWPIIGLEH
jgi:hypothetical protein